MSLNLKIKKTFRAIFGWKPCQNLIYGSRDVAIFSAAKTTEGHWMLLFNVSKNQLAWSHHILILHFPHEYGMLKGYSEIIAVTAPSILIKSKIFAFW